MDVGRPMPRFVAALAGPIGPWARRALLIACGAILWGAAWMPGARFVEMLGWFAAGAIVCYTLARRLIRTALRTHHVQPPLRSPASERFGRWQISLVVLAISSPLFWWPLRVSLLIQRPLLNRFDRYAYEDRPMSSPPSMPRMIGGFVVDKIWVAPTSITLRVLGGGMIQWSSDASDHGLSWMRSQPIPWYYQWAIPPCSGNWEAAPEDPRALLRTPQGTFVP
jgi:hypothetical protein